MMSQKMNLLEHFQLENPCYNIVLSPYNLYVNQFVSDDEHVAPRQTEGKAYTSSTQMKFFKGKKF